MKALKITLAAILVMTLAFGTVMLLPEKDSAVYASVEGRVYRDITIVLDGETLTPVNANGEEVEPFIIDGTTYLPVRAISEALDLEVEWDAHTRTVFINGVTDAELSDNVNVYINGKKLTARDANGAKVYPVIVDGTTYLPVRAIGEAFGKSVSWDDATSTVTLSTETHEAGEDEIYFNGTAITTTAENVTIDGSTATITAAGTYYLIGTLTDGQLIIDATKDDKITLVLNGVSINNDDGAAIWGKSSDKITITTAKGTLNYVSDGGAYADTGSEDAPTAVIFSKDDITVNGEGTLYVTSEEMDGISSTNDIKLTGGTVIINAGDDGIRGKDSVVIKNDVVLDITSGGDGIKSTNDSEEGQGYITIENGTVTVNAGEDAISAVTLVTIEDGDIDITSGGSSTVSSFEDADQAGTMTPPDMNGDMGQMTPPDGGQTGGFGGRGDRGGQMGGDMQGGQRQWGDWGQQGTQAGSIESAKGIKSTKDIVINGGNIAINSSDDSIHANGTVTINGGTLDISSGDDGIHADDTITINDGDITVTKSYEGIEALKIYVNGGNIDLTTSDDGFNAAGGNDGSSINGRMGQNMFAAVEGCEFIINGGDITVTAGGDGLDSNGNLTMNGGNVVVYGPTNSGNGAIDYNGTFNMNGGELLAGGAAGMDETISSASKQYGVKISLVSRSAGSTITIKDASGNEIASYTAKKSFSSLVYSSDKLKSGQSYTVYADGEQVATFTVSSISNTASENGAVSGGFGGGFGDRGGWGNQQRTTMQ